MNGHRGWSGVVVVAAILIGLGGCATIGYGPVATERVLSAAGFQMKLAATPEQWWGLVRFDPDRSVRIEIEDQPEYAAWLVVMPPAHAGQQSAGQDCDCDVATVIAGEATEGAPGGAVLRPGVTRVHGQRHRLRGHGAGYSISLHARATPSTRASADPLSALSKTSARISSSRNVEVIG